MCVCVCVCRYSSYTLLFFLFIYQKRELKQPYFYKLNYPRSFIITIVVNQRPLTSAHAYTYMPILHRRLHYSRWQLLLPVDGQYWPTIHISSSLYFTFFSRWRHVVGHFYQRTLLAFPSWGNGGWGLVFLLIFPFL